MKILVVEDDELNAYALTAVLTNQNYAVEVATDGDVAWDLIQTYDYDLILLDVMLPKLDGISLCRKIRSSGLQMPILLLTGRDSSHDKAIGLDAGADDYVVKPFDQEELIARIRALLRRQVVTSQPVLEYGQLRLDPSSCEVSYAGNLLPLTPKEFALLELFLRNNHRVFSCDMILEHLWSYQDTPQEEAVRTHIKGLRHKLKAVGANSDFVETVYGIGYRLKQLEEGVGNREQGENSSPLHPSPCPSASSPSQVPNLQSQQQALMAVAEIWQRFQGRVDEQVKVLEEAIAILNQNSLNAELLSLAAREAHTLAGSLGTFGLLLGSKLARNIELLLSSGQSLSKFEISNLASWVKLLRREIEGNDAAAISALPTPQVLTTVTQPPQNHPHAGAGGDEEVRGDEGAGEDREVNSPLSLNLQAINELELRVAERTAELITLNRQLQSQLDERQQTQEELRFSEARFARILDIADDAIISINGFQSITLFNQGAEKIFGYSAQEVIGQDLDVLLPQRFFQMHRQHVVDFGQSPNIARRMGERREIYGRRKDGTEFTAEASISKIDMVKEIFYTVILRDITERKQIERMKDEFVSVVSHELRTPLTSIHGSLGMLASGLLPTDSEQGKRLLQIATESTERLVRLINDILDIERIESGKAKMEPEICNIVDLIAQAVNVMQPLADKAGVTLSISALSGQVLADCDRIIQTLTNLLSNAIKFSSAGSTVWLGAQQQGDEVLLTVKDNGRGIPSDKLESIFERFQQVDSSDSRNHDGTGLGLAICKSIMQQHGGRIWVESVLGQGSTFYLTLPLFGTFQNPDLENSSNIRVNKS
ncbi:response regulator [Nostoc sphaeroides CHAB 2801]|uniref:ATP-binding protein n=1 Tax=Nostoc sphaeroides TaxID=446679 RepID=UPI000E470432|nr:ATP-binding protein [Nostoc sphaeroides]MCC5626768.1 response regulator [Nostoc sphaeroides CHAB 2801]